MHGNWRLTQGWKDRRCTPWVSRMQPSSTSTCTVGRNLRAAAQPTLRSLQELQDGKTVQSNLESSADRLVTVPKPRGGLLLCDETGVSYIRPGQPQKRVAMSPTAIMVSLSPMVCAARWG